MQIDFHHAVTYAVARRPLIFDLNTFALEDGPGIRTTVFLKGCPLSCTWCQNPESMASGPEIAFHAGRCMACGACVEACPEAAVDLGYPGRIDRSRCTVCGDCVGACPTTALEMVGRFFPEEELVRRLLANRAFYETSGGGVTFSGGEPTQYAGYVGRVMEGLKAEGIHIAIQTSGMFDLREFEAGLLPWLDLIFFDIKLMDPEEHRRFTGRGNDRILENFTALSRGTGVEIVPRVPLVPGITDSRGNLDRIGRFLKGKRCGACVLLPYNPAGDSKRAALGSGPLVY
ncbi:MAG: glycyl-radical enzyme activating protein [Deltaproteobacteria bacterium]|nr:glycyl-radical enzyme activating protein [Deltaproteobacteria bacterium]